MPADTNSESTVAPLLLSSFDEKTDHRLLFRKLGICAENIHENTGFYQVSFLMDYEALEREKNLQKALIKLRSRYGANTVFKGKNLLEGSTQLERNMQIGGHRS